ncbi:MAG: hypothetical protein GWP75_06710, partial [Planctomycetia bacterium]|nr:hypothetical protein [Planctomycetia bacterium]
MLITQSEADYMKSVLLVKAKGGLGNRLLALLPPLAWASHHGVGVSIDWRDGMYARRGEDAFFNLFKLNGIEIIGQEDIDLAAAVRPAVWRGRVDATVFGIAKEVDPLHGDNPPLNRSKIMHRKLAIDLGEKPAEGINVFCAYQDIWRGRRFARRAIGVPNATGRMDFLRKCFHKFITPRPEITGPIEDFVRTESGSRNAIGVHFRNTDRQGRASMHFSAIDRILRRQSDSVVFLATDSEAGLALFQDRYGSIIRVMPK